jgi:acetyltransferase-like isoleucine patch superfamily enzyme
MAVDRWHAFAEGTTFPAPERLGHLPPDHPQHALAKKVWDAFRAVATVSEFAYLGPNAWPINLVGHRNAIAIGANSVVRGVIRAERSGHVHIADYCYIGDDVILSAHVGIDIEADVLIAHGCQIFDNVTHPIEPALRAEQYRSILGGRPFDGPIPAAPIRIERNAWIGMNSIIMRGARIGAGCIVAAGSIVVGDTPPGATVAGNPARVIKYGSG